MFPTIEALEAAIRRHIETTNADPRPFVRAKSADLGPLRGSSLDSVLRFCQRTADISKRQGTFNTAH